MADQPIFDCCGFCGFRGAVYPANERNLCAVCAALEEDVLTTVEDEEADKEDSAIVRAVLYGVNRILHEIRKQRRER